MASAELMKSALGVLRALASFVTSVLLALDLAWVASDEARLLQHTAKFGVRENQSPRDAVTNRGRLRRDPAAPDVHREIVLAARIGELERLMHDHPRRLATEIILERAIVDDELAVAHRHPDAGNRALALTGGYVNFSSFGHED